MERKKIIVRKGGWNVLDVDLYTVASKTKGQNFKT